LSIALSVALLVAAAAPLLAATAPPAAPAVSPEEVQAAKAAVLVALARSRTGDLGARAGEVPPGAGAIERFAASYGMGDTEEAWARMRKLQLDDPELPWGETAMGRIYVLWKLRDQAEAAFARALKLQPGFPLAVLERGYGERRFGQLAEARQDAERVLSLDKSDARALLLLAQLDEDEGAAIGRRKAGYTAAFTRAPQLFEAALGLARIADEEGDSGAARSYYERAAKLAPRDADVQRKVAAFRADDGDAKGAADALQNALQLGGGGRADLIQLAELQHKLGNAGEEEKLLRRLRRLDPADRAPIVRLLELHRATKDPSAMEDDLKALLALDPSDAGAHLELAERRAKAKDLLGQIEELQLAASGTAYPEAKDAPARARSARAALKLRALAPAEPLRAADVQALQKAISRVLDHAYEERRKDAPTLAGRLKIRLRVSAKGEVQAAELVEDNIGDPALAACALLTVRDARVDEQRAGAFSFVFDLQPSKAKAPNARVPKRKRR
jgi:Tfp pilus assembly protein PilF